MTDRLQKLDMSTLHHTTTTTTFSASPPANNNHPHLHKIIQHFSSKNFIVDAEKGPLNYGVDLVLYEGDKSQVHSTFCVLIVAISSSSSPSSKNVAEVDWLKIARCLRVVESVKKKLIVCGWNEEKECVDYVNISRWIPNEWIHTINEGK